MKKTYTNPAIVLREMEEELMQSVSDSETVITEDGITIEVIPVWKWLLQK